MIKEVDAIKMKSSALTGVLYTMQFLREVIILAIGFRRKIHLYFSGIISIGYKIGVAKNPA